MKMLHIPVMASEVVSMLMPVLRPSARILDMTFGAGGHLKRLMESTPGMTAFALDRDPAAFNLAKQMAEECQDLGTVVPLLGRFSEVSSLLQQHDSGLGGPGCLDAVLMDCGCCSSQLSDASRGFCISADGPLDMRMDGRRFPETVTAAQVLQHASERTLTRILRVYGEERRAVPIVRAIVEARYLRQVPRTTGQLAALVEGVCAHAMRDKLGRPAHAATKVFQALRIFVNDEINQIGAGLKAVRRLLRPGGRLAVISFHSLEDRVAKQEIQSSGMNELPSRLHPTAGMAATASLVHAVLRNQEPLTQPRWRQVNKKVVLPSAEEVQRNPRGRSAKLRVAERLETR